MKSEVRCKNANQELTSGIRQEPLAEGIIENSPKWGSRTKRVNAIRKLVEDLNKKPNDIKGSDFKKAKLMGMLHHYYNASPYEAVNDAYPELNLRPWQMKKTPNGFWKKKKNRVEAVKWLMDLLKKKPKDLELKDFTENGFAGLIKYYRGSLYLIIKDVYPNRKMMPWELGKTPKGYFDKKENRVAAIKWLVEKLKKTPAGLLATDFQDNGLDGLLEKYNGIVYLGVQEAYSEINVWDMDRVTARTFDDAKNRKKALRELVKKLKIDPRDITAKILADNGLSGITNKKGVYAAVIEAFPKQRIKPWEMKRTPAGYFDSEENVIKAVRWVVRKLNKKPQSITAKDLQGLRLGPLIKDGSIYYLVRLAYPSRDIKAWEMDSVPKGFFNSKTNRITAIKWLVEKTKKEAVNITYGDFQKHGLASLVKKHGDSVYKTLYEAGLITFEEVQVIKARRPKVKKFSQQKKE